MKNSMKHDLSQPKFGNYQSKFSDKKRSFYHNGMKRKRSDDDDESYSDEQVTNKFDCRTRSNRLPKPDENPDKANYAHFQHRLMSHEK